MKNNIDVLDVFIVGGGAAAITVAAKLRRRRQRISISVIEPAEKHYYHAFLPFWEVVMQGLPPHRDMQLT